MNKIFSIEGTLNKTFSIEGLPGAGKSVLAELLKKYMDVEVLLEPVEKWKGPGRILENYYQEPKRWAYTFQSIAFKDRVKLLRTKQMKPLRIIERSPKTDRKCFARVCHDNGTMSDLEWEHYNEWYSWLEEDYNLEPDGYIYLRTHPDTCLKRIKKRLRSEESDISLDYLQQIYDKHDEWLFNEEKILKLDGDLEFETDKKILESHVKAIKAFIS